jgi:hydrogenase maturation protein HypF
MARVRLTVTGIVQGVGFRPLVYSLASRRNLSGFVLNTSRGVIIEVEGGDAEKFADALIAEKPPLAEIKTIQSEVLPEAGYTRFEIRTSESAEGEFALISPDIATCPDCLREMYDPADRRYLYPFINCTNCGPRYSIVYGVPYDRPSTTMREFPMCPDCEAEYKNPADRRFHAEPTACPVCGPKVAASGIGTALQGPAGPVAAVVRAMKDGKVAALKGLGGYQLACDAANCAAVGLLRERKRKSLKPFAMMAGSLETIKKYCEVSDAEEALLTGRARPIVLLRKKPGADAALSPQLSPGNNYLGFMLPYTPLHHLLFNNPLLADGEVPEVLVMTSGNLAEEPIVIDNAEAVEKLSQFADIFLSHDRDIYMRVDDSVARVVGGVPRLIRRARGFVPEPLDQGREVPEILACGGELKSAPAITRANYAIISQHIGDLTNYEAMAFFSETLKNLRRTFNADPKVVAHDMHPDYMSTRFAQGYSPTQGEKVLVPVQHHHSHIAACMTENGYDGRVIGVAFDGTGYGYDDENGGTIWGSEFLLADLKEFTRAAHLKYIPLPGGDKAVREPWRIALAYLVQAFGKEGVEIFKKLKHDAAPEKDIELVGQMLAQNINSPKSAGMGRLFDGVSSLIGLRDRITFEGEAAIALEMAAEAVGGSYGFSLSDGEPAVIETSGIIKGIVDDLNDGKAAGVIAGKFHNTVARMVFEVCGLLREKTGFDTIALSGGVFQNATLFVAVQDGLKERGFRVLTHSRVPTNDACISLGQAAIAAARMLAK